MRVLLDTHAALFAWVEPDRLPVGVQTIISNTQNELLFSQASSIEITLKCKLGTLELPEPPKDYVRSRLQRFEMTYVHLDDEDVFGIADLPLIHKDPFDWLLLATARRLSVPLISKDRFFKEYPIEVIW